MPIEGISVCALDEHELWKMKLEHILKKKKEKQLDIFFLIKPLK